MTQMAEDLQAGSAYIQILPSMRGFFRRIQSEVRGGAPVQQDIEPRVNEQALARARQQMERAAEQVAAARRKEADSAGTVRAAEAALEDLRSRAGARASQIVAAEERVAAARRRSEAAMEALQASERRERSATGRVERLEIRADSSQADAEVESFVSRTEGQMGELGDKVKFAAAAGFAAAGAAIGASLVGALNVDAANDKLKAQLGLTGPEAGRYGRIAGDLYSSNYGDSLETVNEALRQVTLNVGASATSSDADLRRITAAVLDVSTAFDQDLGGTTAAVGQLMKTGLAADATQALDIITVGFQGGADKAGDFLDTLNEYGGQFQKLGIDGATATGLLTQGLKAGARDADLVADAFKEFSIRAIDGSKLTGEGFKALGLDGAEMARKIAAGGPQASGALDLVLDRLRGMPDPVQRSQAAVALFGTQAEDLGAALFALDPSTAVDGLGEVGGAASRMGEALVDNAGANLEMFKRQLTTGFVEVVGGRILPVVENLVVLLLTGFGPAVAFLGGILTGTVVPALQAAAGWIDSNRTPIIIVAGLIASLFIPHLIALGVNSTIAGVKTASAWLMTQAGAIRAAVVHSGTVIGMVASWLLLGLSALRHGATVAASWLLVGGISAVTATIGVAVAVASMVAGWVLLGVQSLIQAARVAAAWFIAMGPIGWVIAAVIGLVALIIANWDTVKAVTAAVFSFIGNFLTTVWGGIVAVFNASVAFIVGLWNSFWAGVQAVAMTVWNAIRAAIDFVWAAIKFAFQTAIDFVRLLWNAWWTGLQMIATTVFNAVLGVVTTVWGAIRGAFQTAVDFVSGVWSRFWDGLQSVASTVFNAIKGVIDTVMGGIQRAFEIAVDVVGRVWSGIKALLAKPINFMIQTVYMGGIKKAWDIVAGLLPGIGPAPVINPIPEFAKGGPVRGDQIIRAGEKGDEFVLSAPAIRGLGGMGAVEQLHQQALRRGPTTVPELNTGRYVEGADHDGPGSRTSGFGGVRPHVAQAGWFLKNMFGIGSVGGVGQRANASDHPKGLALDFMTYADQGKGDRLVNYLLPRAGHFAVKYVIWKQRINSGSGWRGMADRGSATANHFDHPHVSFLDRPGGGGPFAGGGDGGGFFDIKAWIREQFEKLTNPLINALPGPPPRWMEFPRGMARTIRDKSLDFLLGKTFDVGGLATGRGVMFKNVIAPERTLDPRTTVAFEQLVGYLQRVPGSPSAGPTSPGMNQGGVEQRLDRLVGLLEQNGAGATITVEDRSGNPVETGRAAAMAIRRFR